ncbi:MAG: response regulator transcription factor [Ruminococcaceae bacterium]|nr:response regulator transcription factor [Oscillospiraceae bacterium]
MNRILVVDDEQSIADMVKLCLSKNGYSCEAVNDGMTATEKIENNRYDLILLDIMLPDIDGYDLIEYIKQFDIPVIFVTAKTSVPDRVKGLKLGAEDYISKPFDLEELLARITTVLRRFHKSENIVEVGKIKIDTLERTVLLNGNPVNLPAKEYDLLLFLIRNNNIALYRETIFEQVWQEPYYGNTRTIDLHIQRLKKKLNLAEAIETIYKVGYKFRAEKLK